MHVTLPYYCFITCVADPSWSFSLQALHSASGLSTQPPGFIILWQSSPYNIFMCACMVLTSRAGTYSASGQPTS